MGTHEELLQRHQAAHVLGIRIGGRRRAALAAFVAAERTARLLGEPRLDAAGVEGVELGARQHLELVPFVEVRHADRALLPAEANLFRQARGQGSKGLVRDAVGRVGRSGLHLGEVAQLQLEHRRQVVQKIRLGLSASSSQRPSRLRARGWMIPVNRHRIKSEEAGGQSNGPARDAGAWRSGVAAHPVAPKAAAARHCLRRDLPRKDCCREDGGS